MSINSYALTTTSRFFDFIGKSNPSSAETTVAEYIINAITDFIENYTKRRFKKTEYSNELYDGQENRLIILKQLPVISTETFTIGNRTTTENDEEWETIDSDSYFVEYSTGIVSKELGATFRRGIKNYRITYTAGFDFDNSSTYLGDVGGADLELATWQLASMIWAVKKGSPDIKGERLGDYSVTYSGAFISGVMFRTNNSGETSFIQSILDKYLKGSTMIYGGLTSGKVTPTRHFD